MVAEDTAKVLEDTMDVIDETLDIMEDRASWLMKNHRNQLILTGIGCFALGLGVGHLIAAKRLSARYQRFADEQIREVKELYSIPKIMPDAQKPSLSVLAGQLSEDVGRVEEIVKEQGYISYDKIETEVVVPQTNKVIVHKNIFESDDPERYFDWDEEQERRENKPDEPYVLTLEEWNDNARDYDQIALNYYDGDDVLTDENDKTCEPEDTVGYESLLRFGHASNDPRVVYVRNNKLEVDYEVTKHDGKFAEEVLGFIEHSDRRPLRKFRPDRE